MPPSNKQLPVIGAILAVLVAGVGGFWLFDKKQSVSHGESHGSARTRMDIQNLALAIQIYVQETGNLPDALSSGARAEINTKRLYATLFGDNAVMLGIGQPAPHWQESKDLVDRWGHALNIVVRTNGEASFVIQVWSNGPNGKNEAGTGDDISGNDLRVEVRREKH